MKNRTHIHNTTKFKLVCFYSHKPDGTPYTSWEKSLNKNRKYHDSYDYENFQGGIKVTRHDKAFAKLLSHVDMHFENIDRAMLFMNDHANQKEILIGYWDKYDADKNEVCEIVIDQQGRNFICLGINGGGIKSYNMRLTAEPKTKKFAA